MAQQDPANEGQFVSFESEAHDHDPWALCRDSANQSAQWTSRKFESMFGSNGLLVGGVLRTPCFRASDRNLATLGHHLRRMPRWCTS